MVQTLVVVYCAHYSYKRRLPVDLFDQALSIQIILPFCNKLLLCLFTQCVSIILDCNL